MFFLVFEPLGICHTDMIRGRLLTTRNVCHLSPISWPSAELASQRRRGQRDANVRDGFEYPQKFSQLNLNISCYWYFFSAQSLLASKTFVGPSRWTGFLFTCNKKYNTLFMLQDSQHVPPQVCPWINNICVLIHFLKGLKRKPSFSMYCRIFKSIYTGLWTVE